MRKTLMTLIVSLLLVTNLHAGQIKLNINGANIWSEVPPFNDSGTVLVPLRVIGENLGAKVDWDNTAKTILITKEEKEIKLAPAKIIKGNSMVPIRFISEELGSQVDWDGKSQTVFIKGEKEPEVGTFITTIKYPSYVEEDVYEGEVVIRDGLKIVHGQGKLSFKNGDVYEGGFKYNLCHGQGKLSYGLGDVVYEGGWEDGTYSGFGKITSPDGPIVEGEFKLGMMNGQGKITYPDGEIHEGTFKDDMMHGRGKIIYPDGEEVELEFDNGFLID